MKLPLGQRQLDRAEGPMESMATALRQVYNDAFPHIARLEIDPELRYVRAEGVTGKYAYRPLPDFPSHTETKSYVEAVDRVVYDLNESVCPEMGMFGIRIDRHGKVYTR